MVLPIRDLSPRRRFPAVNWLFIIANVAVFAWQNLALAPCEQARSVYLFAAIPREVLGLTPLPSQEVSSLLGACDAPTVGKVVVLSVVTSMFLHGDLLHLGSNMLFLYVFGPNVEGRLGAARYVLFYVAGGIIAAVAFSVLRPNSVMPLVGASGAIAAILGAYLIVFPRSRVLTYVPFPLYLLALLIPKVRIRLWLVIFAIVKMPAWLLLTGWIVLQFFAVQAPEEGLVAYEAHIAGFVAGVMLILLLDRRRLARGQTPFHPVRQRGPGPGSGPGGAW